MAKLLYGQNAQSGQMISVYDAKNGLKCQCICPYCQKPLVSKQGADKEWHFAHASKVECSYAPETTVHELAKELLQENQCIVLPNGRKFYYSKVKIERKLHNVRPDAWISNGIESIAVEIFVTHAIEPNKLESLRQKNITMLEIDLSGVPREISKETLAKIVIDGQELKELYEPALASTTVSSSDNFNWFGGVLFILSVLFLLRLFFVSWGKRR